MDIGCLISFVNVIKTTSRPKCFGRLVVLYGFLCLFLYNHLAAYASCCLYFYNIASGIETAHINC